MSEIVINYKSSAIATMDSSGTSILQTEGKYCEDNIEVVYSRPSAPTFTLQTKSIAFTPAETLQTSSVTYDAGYDGLSAVDVSVAAISSSYVGSGVPRKSAADMTRNKSNITAPSGYYSEAAIYNMSNCNALLTQSVDANGLVTAVYSIVTAGYQASGSMTHTTQLSSIGATTYTPSTAAQTISSQYFLTGTQTIEAIPSAYVIPTGTSVITTNGIYDVTSFASASVSVAGITPTGTYSVTSNGIYDITNYASVDVQVSGGGGGGHEDEDAIIDRTIITYENSRVTRVGSYAFMSCASLTTASFPNATIIESSAFASCASLTTVSFPNVISINSCAFISCSSLTTASFPNATYVGDFAFQYCTSLTTVSFPNLILIRGTAFYQTGIVTADFPNVERISGYAFASCTSLTTVSFPNATSVGSFTFQSCSSLTTASFPNATYVGNGAFRSCRVLRSLYLLGSSVATLNNTNAFTSTPISTYTTYTGGAYGSIYVPASLLTAYKGATNWKTYSDRFVSV